MPSLAVLNDMADRDFHTAVSRHREWNLKYLDLREAIFGKKVTDLTQEEAERTKQISNDAGLEVYCLSTGIFFGDVEDGERAWRERYTPMLDNALRAASALQPTFIRLMACQSRNRDITENTVDYLATDHPWAMDMYREAIDQIANAGSKPTIENEAKNCILREPTQILQFFDALNRPDTVGFTWDVLNHWSAGIFPTLAVYEELRPLIQYYHVKGGSDQHQNRRLAWNTTLEDATWPVIEITQQVVADGVSPVICLNPPMHGDDLPDYDYEVVTERDLDFLRREVSGLS